MLNTAVAHHLSLASLYDVTDMYVKIGRNNLDSTIESSLRMAPNDT